MKASERYRRSPRGPAYVGEMARPRPRENRDMQIGEFLRLIVVEPLQLPVDEPEEEIPCEPVPHPDTEQAAANR